MLDVIIPESSSKKGRHMKLLVKVELEKPLLQGTKNKCNNQEVWAEFKYENMLYSTFIVG